MDTFREIAVRAIRANPHQPRQGFDEAKLAELAESIRTHGVIEPLVVVPMDDGYTLIAGERRWRAARIAGLEMVPALVRTAVSDGELRELSLIENVQREDLTVAEEAQAYQALAQEFGLSDEEIGRKVGKARSTVANLRGLTRLPGEVLEKVGPGEGQISQNVARSLAQVAPVVKKIDLVKAVKILTQMDTEFAPDADEMIADLVDGVATPLPNINMRWDLAWPGKPITASDAEGPITIPACKGCEHFVAAAHSCTLPRCLTLKTAMWREHELKRIAKKSGIPIAGSDEVITPIGVDFRNIDKVRRWMGQPPEHLRLMLKADGHRSYYDDDILGSPVVQLATTDASALEGQEKKSKAIVPADASPAAKSKLAAAEDKAQVERRKEKGLKRKAAADIDWLGLNTAWSVAGQIEATGSTLEYFTIFVRNHANEGDSWPTLAMRGQAIEAELKRTKGKEREALLRENILIELISSKISDRYRPGWHEDWPGALEDLEALIAYKGNLIMGDDGMGLKLPKDWNKPPVHRTEANCWTCGTFTANDHITKRDVEEDGWMVEMDGKTVTRVTCGTCSKAAGKKRAR